MQTPLITRIITAVRHQWILVACIAVTGLVIALVAATFTHPKYTATTTLLMVAEPPESSNPLVPSTATKPLLSADLPSLATDATVLNRLRSDLGETATFETLRSRIHAKVNPDSTIMPVTYTERSPDVAIRGANTLGDEIVRFYRQTATTRFDSLIADFENQLAGRRTQLTVLDGQLTGAAKAYPYVDNGSGTQGSSADSVYSRLIALRAQHEELQATVGSDAAAAAATQRLISDATPLAVRDIVNSDSSYRNVRDQYARDFAALKRMNAFGSDRYPGIMELRRTVEREAGMVAAARRNAALAGPASNTTYVAALDAQAKANATYLGDQAKLNVANDQLAALNAQIGQGRVATDVARIRRDHENAEMAYATIAARLAKAIADRAEAASTGSVIVLDRAQYAPVASFASGTVVATGIVLLTIWLALTLAVTIDGTQEWFRDVRTVEQVYDTELIGSLV
jgi:capsular polysaccharide biosynthesis protein